MPKAISTPTTPTAVPGGPPFWDDLLTRPMRRAFFGKPRIVAADGPVAVTPSERARIGHNIHTLVDLLDAIDAAENVDMEDDDPAEDGGDMEPTADDRGEPTCDDLPQKPVLVTLPSTTPGEPGQHVWVWPQERCA